MNIPQQFYGDELVYTWEYKDKAGRTLGYVGRYEPDPPDGSKQVVPYFKKNGAGWESAGPTDPRPLYGLDVLADNPEAPVYVTEGEKAAAAVHQLGRVAVSSLGGSNAANNADWTPLEGRNVVILPDNDEAGTKYADDVAVELGRLGVKSWVVELDELPVKGDVVEWIKAPSRLPDWNGYTNNPQINSFANQLDELTCEAKPTWPEPEPLPNPMGEVLRFDLDLLPESFRGWAADITHRMQCPPDFVAVTAMVAAGSVIGRQCGICPKAKDDWLVVPNTWGLIVGAPATMKSPGMGAALKPLDGLAGAAKDQHIKEMKEHMTKHMATDALVTAKRDALRRSAISSTKNKAKSEKPDKPTKSLTDQAEEILALNERHNSPPVRRRFMVNDATVEKLCEIMMHNPNGVLHFRDELSGWLRDLDREDRASDRAFHLQAWEGLRSYSQDRITRPSVEVPATCESVLGSIQPGPLAQYINQATSNGKGADGLMQRFGMTVWPDPRDVWVNVDEYPDHDARARATDVFKYLSSLDAVAIGATVDEGGVPFLRFSDEAQVLFNQWHTDLMNITIPDCESEALQAHMAKYPSLIPSLALICHLVDGGTGPVSMGAMQQAMDWCAYLESHARRLYAHGAGGSIPEARALAKKIKAGKVNAQFAARDVVQKGWSRLANTDAVKRAIEVLEAHRWLIRQSVTTKGRPAEICIVNPRVY